MTERQQHEQKRDYEAERTELLELMDQQTPQDVREAIEITLATASEMPSTQIVININKGGTIANSE